MKPRSQSPNQRFHLVRSSWKNSCGCIAQVCIQSGSAAVAQLEHPDMGVIPNITVGVTRTSASSPSSPRGSDRVRMGMGGGWSSRWPVSILGGLILLAALAGFVGAHWGRRRLPLAFYLFVGGRSACRHRRSGREGSTELCSMAMASCSAEQRKGEILVRRWREKGGGGR
uniref:Uncharacterized protein n=3 Tax=Aegilops tauschii subsp. strangulata TaxID=200361 RepID=A0A452XZF2_AEGTS